MECNERAELLRSFREIDEAVTEAIADPHTPLVFAGVAEHMPVYEEANTHKGLLPHCIHGNPDQSTPEQLHSRAWELIEPPIRRKTDKLLSQPGTAESEGIYSEDRKEIAHAAKIGQIDFAHSELLLKRGLPTGCGGERIFDGGVPIFGANLVP